MNIDSCHGCAYYDDGHCHVKDEATQNGCRKWREGFWHKVMNVPFFTEEDDE